MFSWRPYVSVSERRAKGQKAMAKMFKKGEKPQPVQINGRTIANSFWGKAWCDHLESFHDYENRLPRGRTYARNGSVIHLTAESGKIFAYVQGSNLYTVTIKINTLNSKTWDNLIKNCSGEIGSVIELMQGKFSNSVMKIVTDQNKGLLPKPNELEFSCSCPDWADMCKHVAAACYGMGSRLDHSPELLFTLRGVDPMELISKGTAIQIKAQKAPKALDGQDLSALFNIDIESDENTGSPEVKTEVKAKAKMKAKVKKAKGKTKAKNKLKAKDKKTVKRAKKKPIKAS